MAQIPYDAISEWEPIGRGSFGAVFRAKWNNRHVAVKEFYSDNRAAIDREVNQLRQVKEHENIIKFLGVSTYVEGVIPSIFVVLEYADCGSLFDFLHTPPRRNYSADHALNWLRQCAAGILHLHTAHEIPILHRDLKPANLLLFNNFTTLKIGDFGTVSELRFLMTSEVGSPIWMAPEVYVGKQYTEKCDVYSWGIMLWEVLCRKMPYSGYPNSPELLTAVVRGARPPPIPNCPKVLENLMKRCWDENPTNRPSMAQVLNEIDSLANQFHGANIPISKNEIAPADQMQTVIQVLQNTLKNA